VLLTVLAAVSVVWIGLIGSLLVQLYQQGDGVVDADLKLLADALARFSSIDSSPENIRLIVTQLKELNAARSQPTLGEDEFAWAVTDANRKMIASSAAAPYGPDADLQKVGTDTRTQFKDWNVIGSWSPNKKIFASVGQASQFYVRANREIWMGALRTYVISLLVLSAVVWLAVRVGLRPLTELAKGIEAIQPETLAAVVPERNYVELQPLVNALNGRVAQVDRVLKRERTFFADAAHELRTPLAALEAQASVVALEDAPIARKQAAAELEAAVARSANVLDKLLTAARVEGLEVLTNTRAFDLSKLVADSVSLLAPRVFAEGKQIEAELIASLEMSGDANAIRLVVENLIDNGARYTPIGSTIKVHLSRLLRGGDEFAKLIVEDDGEGIAESDRGRVFERFVRLADQQKTGSGLGLAIVKRVVELHGGAIRLEDANAAAEHSRPVAESRARGARFIIELPIR
jgi:signal transduction histidine kinase